MSGPPDDLTLLLIASLVATTLVSILLRVGRNEHVPYILLLLADLAALAVARSTASAGIAFVAEAAGVVLSLAPRLIDLIEVRLRRSDRHVGALRLAKLREVLAPGVASSRRRRELEQHVAARSGDADRAIAALQAELRTTQDADVAMRLRGDLVQLQLEAGQLDEALALAERSLGPDDYRRSPELTAAVSQGLAARGRLHAAVQLLVLLEAQGAAALGQHRMLVILLKTRLAFVAGAGDAAALEGLLAQRATRRELSATDVERLRTIARDAIPPAPEIASVAQQIARRLHAMGEHDSMPTRRRAPLTIAIIAANLIVAGVVLALGLGDDELGLARVGALYAPAVAAGEPWRLVSVAFLHMGGFHLVVNMYGLYFLGRAVEESLGWPRLAVVYALSALGGALASLWLSKGLSVGASGAIMGLLASLTVVVFSRRRAFHPAARRMLLGNLVFLALLQGYLGFEMPLIDSAAHGGGFVAGLLATAGLHPADEQSPLARRISIVVGSAYALLCIATLVLVVRTPLDRTLLRLPTKHVTLSGVELDVPSAWQRQGDELGDPYLGIELSIEKHPDGIKLVSPQASDARVRPLLERISTSAHPAP